MEHGSRPNAEAPFFSIIIPAYNAARDYLTQCLDSLTGQSFPALEIILVDDGSREEFAAVYDELAAADPRITVIHQENRGVSAARNNGISFARAPWIMFVDADDWLDPDACEKLHAYLCAQSCDILLYGYVKEFSDGLQRSYRTGLVSGTLYRMDEVEVKERLYRRAMGTPNLSGDSLSTLYYSWDKVYARGFLLQNDLRFPEGLPKSEDKVFILRCLEKMQTFLYQDAAMYHYRINEQSASNRYSPHVDEERRALAQYLGEIARRMDAELGRLKNEPSYDTLYRDYMRFVFGIISDILFSKYYHKDYPYPKAQRDREVREFLASEPFRSAIVFCRYGDLGTGAKVKKFMLSHGLTSLFCEGKKALYALKGQISQ